MLSPSKTDLALNTTLKQSSEIDRFITLTTSAGYPHHCDPPKNWDNFKAVNWILHTHPNRESMILDAGGTPASAFLPALERLGYHNLHALDLRNPTTTKGFITYSKGDITNTSFGEAIFDAVACLSVLEHGVSVEGFFLEMKRLIKIGGSLIISVDYWYQKIENLECKVAYNSLITIFDRLEIDTILQTARKNGFELTSNLDDRCDEKPISWRGFDFTFMILGFKRLA